MPWNFEVHTIDVNQGDSSLLVADDGLAPRRLLIDGGLREFGWWVNQYLANLGVPSVDTMLVTHYEIDHYGGLLSLLIADNFWDCCDTIAGVAAPQGAAGANRPAQVAGTAAGVCAAAWGAYGANAGLAAAMALVARMNTAPGDTDAEAAAEGIWQVTSNHPPFGAGTIFPLAGPRVRNAARAAGVAVANAIAGGNPPLAAARTAIWNSLRTGIHANNRIETEGLFATTTVIDLGNAGAPNGWINAVNGTFTYGGNHGVTAPNVNRARVTAQLGMEVMFATGPGGAAPPANAPAAVVVSTRGWAWDGPNAPVWVGNAGNDQSTGLVVDFRTFTFYTGGDLPVAGEDQVADAVTTFGLPIPGGGGATYPVRVDIPYFKLGHHGS